MARFDQIFDAIRAMRFSLDRLQNAQANKVAGTSSPVQQVLGQFQANLQRANDSYKKATDTAQKAAQAQQTARKRAKQVRNSVVNALPAGSSPAQRAAALASSNTYQNARARAVAARSRTTAAQGNAAKRRQQVGTAYQANQAAQKRASSALGIVTQGLSGFSKILGGPAAMALSLAAGAAGAVGQAFENMKRQLNATHQSLTGFNVAIGQAQFMLKVGDVQRRFNMAQRVESGAVQFAESENRARNAWQSADVFSHNAGSAIGAAGNTIVAQLGEALEPVFHAANDIVEFIRDSGISTFISTWLEVVGPFRILVDGLQLFMEKVYKVLIDIFNFVTRQNIPDDFNALLLAMRIAKGPGAPPPVGNEGGAIAVGKRPRGPH